MDEVIKEKIIQWILNNHMHHECSELNSINLKNCKIEYSPGTTACVDGNYPYVNSLELEKFIESL